MTKKKRHSNNKAAMPYDSMLCAAPVYLLIDSRGGIACAKSDTNDLNKVDARYCEIVFENRAWRH